MRAERRVGQHGNEGRVGIYSSPICRAGDRRKRLDRDGEGLLVFERPKRAAVPASASGAFQELGVVQMFDAHRITGSRLQPEPWAGPPWANPPTKFFLLGGLRRFSPPMRFRLCECCRPEPTSATRTPATAGVVSRARRFSGVVRRDGQTAARVPHRPRQTVRRPRTARRRPDQDGLEQVPGAHRDSRPHPQTCGTPARLGPPPLASTNKCAKCSHGGS